MAKPETTKSVLEMVDDAWNEALELARQQVIIEGWGDKYKGQDYNTEKWAMNLCKALQEMKRPSRSVGHD